VDLSGAGLERFWQLSGGVLRCAVCGSALSPHTVNRWNKTNTYYRCYQRYNSGPRDCTNTCHMPAPALEEAVWESVLGIVSDWEGLLRRCEEHLERQRRHMRGDPDAEARSLLERLEKLDQKEGYLLDVAADNDMPKEMLRAKLGEVEAQRKATQQALREAQARQEALRQPKVNMAHLDSLLLQMNAMDLRMASPEVRRRIYGALRLRRRTSTRTAPSA
jgi:recombinase-like zinc beta ribbon protein